MPTSQQVVKLNSNEESWGGEEVAYSRKRVWGWGERSGREQEAGDPLIGTVIGV